MMTTPAHVDTKSHRQPPKTSSSGVLSTVSTSWLLAGIIVLAICVRLAAALYMGNTVVPMPGVFDQVSYDTLARQLLAGRGFTFPEFWWPATRAGEPTAHWSFLYTLWLAGVYALSNGSPLAARLLQAVVVGVLQPWLTWRISNRLFGRTVGLIAAALVAVYAYFAYYAAALMTETFYIVGILWVLDLSTLWYSKRADDDFHISPWLGLGIALGITVLLRQVFLLFVPTLFLWYLWAGTRQTPSANKKRDAMRIVAGLAIAGGIMMTFILPWTIRNYLAFDRFVLLNTNAGYAFFWANHPIYGTHFVGILSKVGYGYLDLIPKELFSLDEAGLDQALLRRGLGFVIDDPQRYLLLSLSRVQEFFKFWPSADSDVTSNIGRVFSFGLLLPFMLYGLIVALQTSNDGRSRMHVLLYAFMGVYTLIHLLSWALIRYRLPVDAVLVTFAAVGIAQVVGKITSSRRAIVPTVANPMRRGEW